MFRDNTFRARMLASLLDEMHVVKDWADAFRKAYGQLGDLRTIMGDEIPWAGLSATAPTTTFELVYKMLRFGRVRPFWGIDLGADRANLAMYVRPI
ncbi:hypothetical protein C8Q80DRAFT_1073660, partial [Daedaleopsis nitida]